MDDLIQRHLDWCHDTGRSPNTIYNRGYALRALDRHLRAQGVHGGIAAATAREIRQWIGAHKAPATRQNLRMHINSFYLWAVHEEEVLDWSPMIKVPRYKVPFRAPKPVKPEHLRIIFEQAIQPWHLVAVLGTFGGLRASEIAGLNPEDVGTEVMYVLGKGGKETPVDVHPLVAAELGHFPDPATPYLIQAGGRADGRWVSRRGNEYYQTKLGLPVHCHMFRHSFITGVLAMTGNLETARAAARHASITSTVGYAALVNGERRTGILALAVPDAC